MPLCSFRKLFAILCLAFAGVPTLCAQGLTTIDTPQGAMITYGQVAGQRTEAQAMGYILRNIHQGVGDRPKVGKLFQIKGTQAVSVFFTVTNKNHGNLPIKGQLLVTKVAPDNVQGAVITDAADKFQAHYAASMKKLREVWHPFANVAVASPKKEGAAAPALHQVVARDNSAAAQIPANWTLDPQSAGGTLVIHGPNKEKILLGTVVQGSDPRNPAVQRTMAMLRQGQLRGSAYEKNFYYAPGGDMGRAFVEAVQHSRRMGGLPPAKINLTAAKPFSAGNRYCVHATGNSQAQEDGARDFDSYMCEERPDQFGGYMILFNYASVPAGMLKGEQTTVTAILANYHPNNRVIQTQAGALAKPAIDEIHSIGDTARQRSQMADERLKAMDSSLYKKWDSDDRRSQEFSNYMLNYSTVRDNDNNMHGTLWSTDADALVKANPTRFEYVDRADYWKGVDY